MKKVFISILLGLSVCAWGQSGHLNEKKLLSPDSIAQELKKMSDSIANNQLALDTAQIRQEVERNGITILKLQSDNNARQKKAAITRIAIGIGFLIVLVIGLMRKRKK
jgi:hypothetical protein